jgi:hypothetical protein
MKAWLTNLTRQPKDMCTAKMDADAVKGTCDPNRIVVLNQCLGEPGFVGTVRASAPAGDKWLRGPDKDGDGG